MARSISWRSFKHTHQNKLAHIAGYEERFVDLVLSQIHNLSPLDVIPQFHFTDKHGGNRYIDFVIYNQAKGYLLAIELDGYAKMVGNGNDYERFQDFLDRQNDVVKLFGKLLRFSNKQFLNNPNQVIQEIQSSMYATDNELFWFDFKLTQILNNPNIPHKFIYYDFTDLLLKSIYQNAVCQFSITDCITIQHSPKHYIRITLTSTSTEIYCNLTNRKFSKNESFYKDKNTFYSIITTIIDTTKELTKTAHTQNKQSNYPIIPLPNKPLTIKEWEDYYDVDSSHFLIKKVCSKFKDFNLAMLHIHVWTDDCIAFVYTYPFSYKQINYPFYAYITITQEGKELGIPFPNQSITNSWVYTEEDITHNPKQVIHLVNEAIQDHEQTSINQYKQDNPSLLRTVSTGIAKLFGLAKEGVSQLDNAMDRVQEIVTEELIQTLEKI